MRIDLVNELHRDVAERPNIPDAALLVLDDPTQIKPGWKESASLSVTQTGHKRPQFPSTTYLGSAITL